MSGYTYLCVADVIALHNDLVARYGGSAGLRDEGVLESAVMRPQMAAHYQGADLVRQAATLITGLAYTHAFVDGNERTAEMAGFLFLRANGLQIVAPPLGFASAVLAMTELGNIDQAIRDVEAWLRDHVADTGERT